MLPCTSKNATNAKMTSLGGKHKKKSG